MNDLEKKVKWFKENNPKLTHSEIAILLGVSVDDIHNAINQMPEFFKQIFGDKQWIK